MNWLDWCFIGLAIIICILGLIFIVSLGKAAKDADEAFYKAIMKEGSVVTSGCPVDKEGE